ncbi:MAG: HK97 gp10 family phage protein [Clostridia bacterium]|nr:HK97 gp10 family phage protein [Clostridia bacterium]
MSNWGSCNFKELEKFQRNLEKLSDENTRIFCEKCAKELAARLLAKVIKRTPTGVYDKPVKFITKEGKQVSFTPHTGKSGGTLRRGWTAKTEAEAESGTGNGTDAATYANSLAIRKVGNEYQVEIINPIHYASYVEFGHRTANHKGWVQGKFMLTISEQELDAQAPKILENKLKKYLEECFND